MPSGGAGAWWRGSGWRCEGSSDARRPHNARIQLLATLLNTMAGTCFTVGIATPIAAVFFYGAASVPLRAVMSGVLFWLLIAATLHGVAQRVLGGLR
jgi:hypothetical protein